MDESQSWPLPSVTIHLVDRLNIKARLCRKFPDASDLEVVIRREKVCSSGYAESGASERCPNGIGTIEKMFFFSMKLPAGIARQSNAASITSGQTHMKKASISIRE
jgi:hypothetical protein